MIKMRPSSPSAGSAGNEASFLDLFKAACSALILSSSSFFFLASSSSCCFCLIDFSWLAFWFCCSRIFFSTSLNSSS
jgi:hypothetical protein